MNLIRGLFVLGIAGTGVLHAEDVLILNNGEKLIGQLQRSSGTSVTFKSDTVGEVTIPWTKVQELHSPRAFAVIPKGVSFKRNADTSSVPQGSLAVKGDSITINPAAGEPHTIKTADSNLIIDETTFRNALDRKTGLFKDWQGTVTVGASLVQATQQSRTFNGAISLSRVEPAESWLTRRSRTTLDFSESYGTVNQPRTPGIKTDIYHAGLERDQYFSSALFGFAQGLLDHNFSQNLSLQQTYGGGIGWSVIRRADTSFDLKPGVTYIRQKFTNAGNDQSLFGSTFEETYRRTTARGITFSQRTTITPAWNNLDAVSGSASALLTVPMYKRMNSSFGILDSFLNNPPPGFKKNSFQFTAGLTWAWR